MCFKDAVYQIVLDFDPLIRSHKSSKDDDLQLESTPSRGVEVADIWYTAVYCYQSELCNIETPNLS